MTRVCIAVINDEQAIVDMLTDFLQDAGYQTTACFAGAGAYDLIRRKQAALVLIDVHMEHPDAGLHVLQELRADPATATLPVLLCSANGGHLQKKAAALPALHGDVLEKPFRLDPLLTNMQILLTPVVPGAAIYAECPMTDELEFEIIALTFDLAHTTDPAQLAEAEGLLRRFIIHAGQEYRDAGAAYGNTLAGFMLWLDRANRLTASA